MDAVATRLANLRHLVAALMRKEPGTQKAAALALDISPSYLSQLVGGKKMGDDVARKIEVAQRLPHGWMDQVHAEVREESPEYLDSQVLRIDPPTIAAAISLVRLSFANLSLQFDNEDDGVPLAFAYEYLFTRGETIVTTDNLIDFSKKLAEKVKRNQDDVVAEETRTGITRGAGGGHRVTG